MRNNARYFEDTEIDFAVSLSGGNIELRAGGGALLISTGAAEFAAVTVGEALRLLIARYDNGGCQW